MADNRFSGYAYCEPSWATVRSLEHIRVVQADGLHVGGGVSTAALCGFDLGGGWDLATPVDADSVYRGLAAELNPTCPTCAGLWLTATGARR